MTGLEVAKSLPENCCFIFTTAHAQYALDGFELDAVDYLHKPFSFDRFNTAVDKALRRIEGSNNTSCGNLTVKCEYNNVNVPMTDISYIESIGNYVRIVCTTGERILSRTTLKSVLDILPKKTFIRVHRSYIVSVSQISSFSKSKIILKGNKEIPVGLQYMEYCYKQLPYK